MEVIGVIPARFDSTRFKGKVLIKISGKPMIQHVWERAKQAKVLDDLIVACDNEAVFHAVQEFGGKAFMTAKEHACGTDRIVEVINPLEVNIVINIQGDEPLVHPTMIDSLGRVLMEHKNLSMATLMKKISNPEEIENPNVVKVVPDKDSFALYFSRAAVPYPAENPVNFAAIYYKHIGLYGYTKDFLFTYKNLPVSRLERTEKLEQLRVLEAGFKIKLVETKYETVGVDKPEDVSKVEAVLNSPAGHL